MVTPPSTPGTIWFLMRMLREGAAHHDLMIAAARAVLVEVHRPHMMIAQIFAGRARRLDRSGRRDVIGGDRIEQQAPVRAHR